MFCSHSSKWFRKILLGMNKTFAVVRADLRIARVTDAHVSKITLFADLHAITPVVHVIIMIKSASHSRQGLALIPTSLMTKLR